MANPFDQDKEANPIAEIFDEMFTLLQDLETRSVAVLEYIKEQGGATDEKLAPYLDRAAAASDVRWRAARARMEHLLAPRPKSSTDVGKDDKSKGTSQSTEREKETAAGRAKAQGEKQPGAKLQSKDLGKELASAPAANEKSNEQKDQKSQTANPKPATEAEKSEKVGEQPKDASSKSSDTKSHAAALAGGQNSDVKKDEPPKNQSPSDKSSNQAPGEGKPQTQKAAK